MRSILIVLVLISAFSVNAQSSDSCKQVVISDIEYTEDKFDKDITFRTPYSYKGTAYPYTFHRIVKAGKSMIYMYLKTYSSSVVVNEKGVQILLTGGKKIVKPAAEVEVEAGDGGFDYTAFIKLTATDIALLKKYLITDFRLYIFDETIDTEVAELSRCYFNLLLVARTQ